jgi:nitrous oxide reductase
MSKKNNKKIMLVVSIFMVAILAGCSHLPQTDDKTTKKDDDTKTQIETTQDEDGDIDDVDQDIDDDTNEIDDLEMEDEIDDLDELVAKESKDDEDSKDDSKDIENKEIDEKTIVMTSFVEIIDGKYFPQFSQKEITVKKGDKVKFKITNTKGTHDFKIDEFDVFTETPEGQEVEVEFVADKAGEFVYYCTKTGHRQNGHWGTLKVVE